MAVVAMRTTARKSGLDDDETPESKKKKEKRKRKKKKMKENKESSSFCLGQRRYHPRDQHDRPWP